MTREYKPAVQRTCKIGVLELVLLLGIALVLLTPARRELLSYVPMPGHADKIHQIFFFAANFVVAFVAVAAIITLLHRLDDVAIHAAKVFSDLNEFVGAYWPPCLAFFKLTFIFAMFAGGLFRPPRSNS
jgi:hypothetical protein